jgi:hypothetical protein
VKYMLVLEPKDPVAENWEKGLARENERTQKGLSFTVKEQLFPFHFFVTEAKLVAIVETDDEMKVAKWIADYAAYAKAKAIPLVGRAEFTKKMGQYIEA